MRQSGKTARKRPREGETTTPPSIERSDAEAAPILASEDATVVLNVGGTLVNTLKSTLCAQPSRFAEWVHNDFKEFPRDENGHPFIDRDAVNFKHIINYMRGYGLPMKSADLVLLAEDAVFYEVEALREEIGMDPPLVWRFNPGPGVSSDGADFCTSNILGICGTEPLARTASHTRLFRIDRCERVAIGLIGTQNTETIHTDEQLHDQKMSVSYCSTGELIHYWYAEKLYTTGGSFKAQDIIEIRVDFPDPKVGPTASRALFAPYMDPSGALPFAPPAIALPPPSTATGTATGTAIATPTEETGGTGRGQSVPLTGSASLGPSSAQVTSVDADAALPVYVGPSPSLSHAYSTLNQGSATDATSYSNAGGEATPIGAVITIIKAGKVEFVVHWPEPVPPLHYAVSMQGASSVTLLEAGADAAPLTSPSMAVTAGNANFPRNPPNREPPPQRTGLAPPLPPSRPPPPVGSRRRVSFD